MVTHTRNVCSAFTNPTSAHTHTHTHREHTHPEQWAAIYAAAPGEQLWVQCLAQEQHSRGIKGGESAGHSPPTSPPHLQSLPDLRLEPLDCEPNSLTIRPRLALLARILRHVHLRALTISHLANVM